MTRRELLGSTAAALVAGALRGTNSTAAERITAMPSSTSRLKLHTLGYGDVTLHAGPLKSQYDHALDVFLGLDEDRMLKVYRQAAGLDAPGQDMGGWYNADAFAPGHCFGQWLSALSRFAAAGSDEARAKVARLVDAFDATLKHGPSFYDGHRFKAYVYDKHVIGLTDAFRYAGIEHAREVLHRATESALPHLPEKALTRAEMRARPHKDHTYAWDESYTIAENLFIAHQVFGDERYLEMAKRYLHDEPYFDKLARGEHAMVGEHAYSHVNALGSAALAYIVLGMPKHLDALRNAWDMIEQHHSYASGGWGPDEAFLEPGKGLLLESLRRTRKHFETPCGAYATFKHARYLTQITGESRFGDGLERMLYNGILATKPIQPDGRTFYYSDYADSARKTYHPERWPCCAGTYPQATADYLISTYYHDPEGVYVNLYVPSELRWKRANGGDDVKLTQETQYPDDERIRIRVEPSKMSEFAVNLRIPRWAEDQARISINGDARETTPPRAGQFATIRRTWSPGDTVDLTLPLPFRTEPLESQHPSTVAILRGPVMYVGVSDRPALSTLTPQPSAAQQYRFVPFYKINDETYTTYFERQGG